jgi:hypothetical protein
MNCDEIRAAYLQGGLSEGELAHLGACPECRRVRDDLDAAAALLRDPALWEEPPADLEDRVVGAVAGASATGERRRRSRFKLFTGIAAAVVVVAAVAAALLVTRSPAPDWEVAIAGNELSSGARGTVSGWNTPAGTRVAIDVTGLGPAPAGHIYEMWFSAGSIHLSAGTFRSFDDVELWVGAARADFPRIWVTLEPIDGDESPSGRTVLDTGA